MAVKTILSQNQIKILNLLGLEKNVTKNFYLPSTDLSADEAEGTPTGTPTDSVGADVGATLEPSAGIRNNAVILSLPKDLHPPPALNLKF